MVLESGALLLVGAMRCDVLGGLLIFFVRFWIWVCSLGDFWLALVFIVVFGALLIVCFAGTAATFVSGFFLISIILGH